VAEQITLEDLQPPPPLMLVAIQITRQHRWCVCYGAPRLGKTLSARTYAAPATGDWDR